MAESKLVIRIPMGWWWSFFPLEWKHFFGDGRMEGSGFIVILSQCK